MGSIYHTATAFSSFLAGTNLLSLATTSTVVLSHSFERLSLLSDCVYGAVYIYLESQHHRALNIILYGTTWIHNVLCNEQHQPFCSVEIRSRRIYMRTFIDNIFLFFFSYFYAQVGRNILSRTHKNDTKESESQKQ